MHVKLDTTVDDASVGREDISVVQLANALDAATYHLKPVSGQWALQWMRDKSEDSANLEEEVDNIMNYVFGK